MMRTVSLYHIEALLNCQLFACSVKRGADARSNRFQGRGNKHGEEWYHARTDDQKIETADDKMLCPDGIYL